MDPKDIATIGTAIAGLIMAGAALYNSWGAKQKNSGDFASLIASASASVIEQYKLSQTDMSARLAHLETQVRALETENTLLKSRLSIFEGGVALLVNQLQALGHRPIWTPPGVSVTGRDPAQP